MTTHRTSVCLDDAAFEALRQVPAYQRSGIIRGLLLNANPQDDDALRLKTRLGELDQKLFHTRVILKLARELDDLAEEEGKLNSPRTDSLHAIALRACLVYGETKSPAAKDVLKRALSMHKDFCGEPLSMKEISTELDSIMEPAKEEEKHDGTDDSSK